MLLSITPSHSVPYTPPERTQRAKSHFLGCVSGLAVSPHALPFQVFLLDLTQTPQADEVHLLVCDKVALCQPGGQRVIDLPRK